MYYTHGTFPRIFCWKQPPSFDPETPLKLISFSWGVIGDTVGDTNNYYRIDFGVKGEQAAGPIPQAQEQADGQLNYYFPHTQPNGVTGVRRYQRVFYEDIYPKINLHLYSNEVGLKAYFEIEPGGDPNMITGHFTGQDSITDDTLGVKMWLREKHIRLNQAFAYEVDAGNNVTPLMWSPEFVNPGNGDISFTNIGSWNTSNTLVLQIGGGMTLGANSINTPQWCTYYGDDDEDYATSVETDGDHFTYMAGHTYSTEIPAHEGQIDEQFQNNGVGDAFITCFDENYALEWAMTIGGFTDESFEDIVINEEGETPIIWAVGWTNGDAFPSNSPGGYQGYFEGGSANQSEKAIFVRINATDGSSDLRSYFGGSNTRANSVDLHSDGNIYMGGSTSNGDINENAQCVHDAGNPDRFTVCNPFNGAYYQNFNAWDNNQLGQGASLLEGFIAKLDVNTQTLEWSTLYGGFRADAIMDIHIDRTTDDLYMAGRTKTDFDGNLSSTCIVPTNGDFPLCDAGGLAWFQQSANGAQEDGAIWDGFVGRFDSDHNITWGSYLGGDEADGASSIYVSPDGDIYVAGWTATQDTIHMGLGGSTSSQEFPVQNSGSEYTQAFGGGTYDAWLWRFDSGLENQYGTLIGGEGDEVDIDVTSFSEKIRHEPNIDVSENGLVFVSGFTTAPNASSANAFPFEFGTGLYNQSGNNDAFENDFDKSDGFFFGMDGDNEMMWSTYFGGSGFGSFTTDVNVGDACDAIAFDGNKIFVVGRTYSVENFPHACPTGAFCNNNPSGVVNEDHSSAYIAQVNEKLWVLADESDAMETGAVQMAVYPNPFTEKVYVQVSGSNARISYRLLDISGKLIDQGSVNQSQGIEFSHLQTGLYLLQLDGSSSQVFKIVKQ